MSKAVICLLLAAAAVSTAQARVYHVPQGQALVNPFFPGSSTFGAAALAIDGDSIIVVASVPGDVPTVGALLYRRGTDGQWRYGRVLTQAPRAEDVTPQVVMKNSLAVIQVGQFPTIWEKVNNDWRQGQTGNTPILSHGGFAISQDRIMVGADGCPTLAYFYQKNSSGVFTVTGRIAGGSACVYTPREVELNYDNAMVRIGGAVNHYRRGAAQDWPFVTTFPILPSTAQDRRGAPALQNDTVVLPDNTYFRFNGTRWGWAGRINPIDWAAGTGDGSRAIYRDGLLINADGWDVNRGTNPVYVYRKNTNGSFDHVGITDAWASTQDFDLSGRTIVASEYRDFLGFEEQGVSVYDLPADIVKPRAIYDNFDARDVSAFTTSAGSQYAIAGNSYNYLYRQSALTVDTAAVLEHGNWRDYQEVQADIRPTAFGRADGWVGLAARYLDENNYYFVTLGNDDTVKLQRKLNGVVTTLAQKAAPVPTGGTQPVTLRVEGDAIVASVGSGASAVGLTAHDSSIQSGRTALLTSGARADFDNLAVLPSQGTAIFSIDTFNVIGRPFAYSGGSWSYYDWDQEDTSGLALAVNGLANLTDQSVSATIDLVAFGSSEPVAWAGVLARYRDAKNYYYASLRSSNQLQIRKVVNGVTTVLRAVQVTVAPGKRYIVDLYVLGDELTATVHEPDQPLAAIARAIDDDIPSGKFGVGTYRANASFRYISVYQP